MRGVDVEEALTSFLGWEPPLTMLRGGSSSLLDRIDVFVDFDWDTVVGHRKRTFTNYMSLGKYVRRFAGGDRRRALILTNQNNQREGCRADHDTHDIFIVNLDRYRSVASNDAAGAYFAGLKGLPIINDPDDTAAVLDAFGSPETVAAWISRHPDSVPVLAERIERLPLRSASIQRLIEEIRSRLYALEEDDAQALLDLLCASDFPGNLLRAASLARREDAVEEFKRELAHNEWSEGSWQDFFEREEWIFGHGLLYQFQRVIQREAYVGGKVLSNRGGQVADFLARTIGCGASFITIVDIKTPSAKLVSAKSCRNDAHAIDEDLAEAVAQILSNCNSWNRVASLVEDNVVQADREGWQTAQPRGIVVIGNSKTLETADMRKSFELFRRHLHGIEVITFDELLVRAEMMASPEPTKAERNGDARLGGACWE